MTHPAQGHRTVTRWRALALLAAAVLLAGCQLATGTVRTATRLQDAGVSNPNLHYNDGVATLEYDADPNPLEARAEQDRAAAVIWRNLPFRIDRITVVADGGTFPSRRDYPRALLERQLGPRPAGLDRSVADIVRQTTLIAAAVALVLMVLVVVVILLVLRAVRGRPTPQPAGAWPQGAPQPWGQAPPGQPWGRPAPAPPGQPWGQPPQRPAPPPGPGDTRRPEPGPAPPPPPREERGPTPPN
jgi:hypothetical protein